MIFILHKKDKVISVFNKNTKTEVQSSNTNLVEVFFDLSKRYKNTLIIWCDDDLKEFMNLTEFSTIFHHKLIMTSYSTSDNYYIDDRIGYVESSPFINVNKKVTYPTWLMSSCIGGVNSDVLSCYNQNDYISKTFSYVINSIAKRGMTEGLFCYSEPNLLTKNTFQLKGFKPSKYELFKFIKAHYRSRWAYLTFFNSLVYEKQLLVLPFLKSFFTSKKRSKPNFEHLKIAVNKINNEDISIDVIIPSIGRKQYLYDVLKDLANQTLLPKSVIIIEQNPDEGSVSELDYLKNQSWPFQIKHTFINKTGACNARNMALQQIESDWIFMADDDIKFEKDILEIALKEMFNYSLKAATLSCLRKEDKKNERPTLQWNTFGSGCSIISKSIAEQIVFDTAFEHGFGEDGDYGIQVRNIGEDIGYISKLNLLHIKAPIGGFRTKITQPWQNDKIQPKPSPTIMLFNLKNQSKKQILGYKTLLFIKFFSKQKNKNIFTYFFKMKKRWDRSTYWANKLKNSVS
ncbi:glycosyltransferase family 2 protein [Pontimicrobium aquaticum]|uniref:Glycosyltransferase family 2 protein n=1 Tax=Pontimicrobium aquaticum TaxID=2565367 RepID=A0A4U0EMT9_9FLAO|nr:glycosyltransferase family A protein [Pontimicrobium aquaticum]TJY32907.1 glycosyltransferase family 2 protein [Pontimicrobium aquaticum]